MSICMLISADCIRPKKGSMVIWANMLDKDPLRLPDSRTLHEARPVANYCVLISR